MHGSLGRVLGKISPNFSYNVKARKHVLARLLTVLTKIKILMESKF